MRLALELADTGLIALPEEGESAPQSPGIALIDDDGIMVGRAAAAHARLRPRRVHNRFWLEISTEALGRPFGRRLRSADLAHAHLSEFWREIGRGVSSVILTLSGGRSTDQLGLILGVARAAGLPVDGMVDAAVAGSGKRLADGAALHLDLELHRAVLTVLQPGPERSDVLTSDRVGLSALHEAWLRLSAGAFLKITRFDPLHSATSEQQLSDQLSHSLDVLRRRASCQVSLTSGDQVFSIELDRDRVVAAADDWYGHLDSLVRSGLPYRPSSILITARAAAMPGLRTRLSSLAGLEVVELPLAAAPSGALGAADRICSQGRALPFITNLAEPSDEGIDTSPTQEDTAARHPTHLVVGGVAHRLRDLPLWLGSAPPSDRHSVAVGHADLGVDQLHCVVRHRNQGVSVEPVGQAPCTLNGEPIQGRAGLSPGDRLRLGEPGVRVDFIAVES